MSLYFLWAAVILLTVGFAFLAFFLLKLKRQFASLQSSHPQSGGIKHWSFVKYNPFPETGGEYSFIITLLDGLKNGIILTSLHGRGVTRFYAKEITGGVADQDLSQEEQQALHKALK